MFPFMFHSSSSTLTAAQWRVFYHLGLGPYQTELRKILRDCPLPAHALTSISRFQDHMNHPETKAQFWRYYRRIQGKLQRRGVVVLLFRAADVDPSFLLSDAPYFNPQEV